MNELIRPVTMYRVGEADNGVSGGGSSLLSLVRSNRAGLATLRDDHLEILDNIRRQQPGTQEPGAGDIEERITAVTESLQLLEVGVAESGVMLSLAAHFDTMESERTLSKMEMRRVKVSKLLLKVNHEKIENTFLRMKMTG